MKRLFASLAIAVLAVATPALSASYSTVERVSVWDNSCGCTVPSLAVKVDTAKTEYVAVGEQGLTTEIYFDKDLALAFVSANYGVDAEAVLQVGGGTGQFEMVDPDGVANSGDEYEREIREGSSW